MQPPRIPFNIMMCGLPGSGKSAIAEKFAAHYKLTLISASALRHTLNPHYDRHAPWHAVWDRVMDVAAMAGAENKNVLFDATNLRAGDRVERLLDLRMVVPGPWVLCEMQTTLDGACENVKGSYLENEDVMADILSEFQSPSLQEGFDRIVTLRRDGSVARNLVRTPVETLERV